MVKRAMKYGLVAAATATLLVSSAGFATADSS